MKKVYQGSGRYLEEQPLKKSPESVYNAFTVFYT